MADRRNPKTYEPPRIESVLTPEEIEREALYAGIGSGGGKTKMVE